jgi:hypothetical protein
MGGFHATLVPNEMMGFAEAIVIGEAKQSFRNCSPTFARVKCNGSIAAKVGTARLRFVSPPLHPSPLQLRVDYAAFENVEAA